MKGHLSSFYSSASIWLFLLLFLFLSLSSLFLCNFSPWLLSFLLECDNTRIERDKVHPLERSELKVLFLEPKTSMMILNHEEKKRRDGDKGWKSEQEEEREGWGEWDVDGRLLTQERTFFFPELLFFFVPCPSLFSRVKITTQLNNFCLSSSFSFFFFLLTFFLSSSLLPFHSIPIFSHHLFHSSFSFHLTDLSPRVSSGGSGPQKFLHQTRK